ncbi:hypothetical protein GCM10027040_28050 [Halomonas shantousis]
MLMFFSFCLGLLSVRDSGPYSERYGLGQGREVTSWVFSWNGMEPFPSTYKYHFQEKCNVDVDSRSVWLDHGQAVFAQRQDP